MYYPFMFILNHLVLFLQFLQFFNTCI